MSEPSLDTTLMLAVRAHYGRTDKGGQPYILHPIRIMMRQTTLEARQVALLHDVIEDTDMTLDHIREYGFSEVVIEAMDAITRRPDEPYLSEYIERVALNRIATAVKIDDLLDNMDPTRLVVVTAKDQDRIDHRYKPALQRLFMGTQPEPTLLQIQPLRHNTPGVPGYRPVK